MLYFSARHCSAEKTEILIGHGGNVNAKTNDGVVPLEIAFWRSNIILMKHLLDNGADVNVGCEHGGSSILHRVANFPRC
jgi:ankyrin repeat protein